jgi:hypothetical protein
LIPQLLAAAIAAVLVAPTPVAAETVESPIYKSWARTKVGTVVTIKSVTVMKGSTLESSMRYKLVALSAEKATVEMVLSSRGVANPPQKLEYRRDFPLFPGMKREDIGKPVGATENGLEPLMLAGKEYKTQWYVTKGKTEAGESIARTWTAEDVPGMLLKSVITVPAADKTTTIEVVEIKVP